MMEAEIQLEMWMTRVGEVDSSPRHGDPQSGQLVGASAPREDACRCQKHAVRTTMRHSE